MTPSARVQAAIELLDHLGIINQDLGDAERPPPQQRTILIRPVEELPMDAFGEDDP